MKTVSRGKSHNEPTDRQRGLSLAALLFFEYIFLILPVYFENGFFNMLQAKYHCLIFGTAAAVIFSLFVVIVTADSKKKTRKKTLKDILKSLTLTDIGILIFGALTLLSSALSGNFLSALTGSEGFSTGAVSFLSAIFAYFLISRFLKPGPSMWKPVFILHGIICLLAVFNEFVADPFGFYENMTSVTYDYLSTLGQKNWAAGYLCMMLPLAYVFYLEADTLKDRILYLIFLVPAIAMLSLLSSDAVFLGLFACAAFALPYVLRSRDRVVKTLILGLIFFTFLLIFGKLPALEKKRTYLDGISLKLMQTKIDLVMMIVLGALIAAALVIKKWFSEKTVRILTILIEAVFAVVIVLAAVWTVRNFSDSFGSERGLIWRTAVEAYTKNFTLKEKLFGVGPDMLRSAFEEIRVTSTTNTHVATAHSDILQTLLSMGVLGLIVWLFTWGTVILTYFRRRIWEKKELAFFLPLCAYGAFGLVSSSITMNLGLLAAFAGLLYIKNRGGER